MKSTRGRVLSVRLGSNPNSSSLGVDVTLLLAGGAAVGLVCLLGGAVARFVLRRRTSRADRIHED